MPDDQEAAKLLLELYRAASPLHQELILEFAAAAARDGEVVHPPQNVIRFRPREARS